MESGRLGSEQYEDQELPTEVRDLCTKVPRKRHGVSPLDLRQTCNIACVWAWANQLNRPQTNERVEKALETL